MNPKPVDANCQRYLYNSILLSFIQLLHYLQRTAHSFSLSFQPSLPQLQSHVNSNPTVEAIDSHKLRSLLPITCHSRRHASDTLHPPSNIHDHLRVLTLPPRSPSVSKSCYDRRLRSPSCCSSPSCCYSFPSYRHPWSRGSRSLPIMASTLACLDIAGQSAVASKLAMLQVGCYSRRLFQKCDIVRIKPVRRGR